MSPRIGEILALATAFCWTISSISFEGASRRVGSLPVNLIRLSMAFVGLSLVGWLGSSHRIVPTDASSHAWKWLLLSGAVGFFIGDLALFRAYVLIGARVASLLMSLAPLIAAFAGAILLHDRLSALTWIGMSITLAGIAWVVSERTSIAGAPIVEETTDGAIAMKLDRDAPSPRAVSNPPGSIGTAVSPRDRFTGVVLGVIAAAGQGIGLILGKIGMQSFNRPFGATQIRATAGIVGFAALVLVRRDGRRVLWAIKDKRAMVQMSIGAIAGPLVGVSLLLMSMQYNVSAGVAQTFAALVPVLIIPFVVFVKHERVTFRAILGAAIAVAGVAILLVGG